MTNESAEIEGGGRGVSLRVQFGTGFLYKCFAGPLEQFAGILEDRFELSAGNVARD